MIIEGNLVNVKYRKLIGDRMHQKHHPPLSRSGTSITTDDDDDDDA